MSKLVHGWGINDVDYPVKPKVNGKVQHCPFYVKWQSMLKRVHSEKYQSLHPTYSTCLVCEEWKYFSVFRAWMIEQDWEGKHLDKDLLIKGNRVYGPSTCLFLTPSLNNFILNGAKVRGKYPIGVHYKKGYSKPYVAHCRHPFIGGKEHLGNYATPEEAHQVWLKRKQEFAKMLGEQQSDPRVAEALIRYYDVEIFE